MNRITLADPPKGALTTPKAASARLRSAMFNSLRLAGRAGSVGPSAERSSAWNFDFGVRLELVKVLGCELKNSVRL